MPPIFYISEFRIITVYWQIHGIKHFQYLFMVTFLSTGVSFQPTV